MILPFIILTSCFLSLNLSIIVLSFFFYHLPGRIDRKIEFPLPDQKTKRRIFNIHTNRMTLSDDVDLEEYILAKDDLSGADIKVIISCSYFDLDL